MFQNRLCGSSIVAIWGIVNESSCAGQELRIASECEVNFGYLRFLVAGSEVVQVVDDLVYANGDRENIVNYH